MANQITHRRMSGGTDHEHIIRVKGPGFDSSVAEVVSMIESGRASFYVNGSKPAQVGVRTSTSGRKYIQTHADGYWNNNLLALPTY